MGQNNYCIVGVIDIGLLLSLRHAERL